MCTCVYYDFADAESTKVLLCVVQIGHADAAEVGWISPCRQRKPPCTKTPNTSSRCMTLVWRSLRDQLSRTKSLDNFQQVFQSLVQYRCVPSCVHDQWAPTTWSSISQQNQKNRPHDQQNEELSYVRVISFHLDLCVLNSMLGSASRLSSRIAAGCGYSLVGAPQQTAHHGT